PDDPGRECRRDRLCHYRPAERDLVFRSHVLHDRWCRKRAVRGRFQDDLLMRARAGISHMLARHRIPLTSNRDAAVRDQHNPTSSAPPLSVPGDMRTTRAVCVKRRVVMCELCTYPLVVATAITLACMRQTRREVGTQ